MSKPFLELDSRRGLLIQLGNLHTSKYVKDCKAVNSKETLLKR